MGARDGFAQQRAIWSIRVGRRQRQDLGDIDQLMDSMRTLGLLQPITVDPDGVLICGARRLEAARRLGWKTIRVWVREGLSTPVQQLLAEQHENTMRKPFTPSEAAGIYEELKTLYAEDAARRQHARPARRRQLGDTGSAGWSRAPRRRCWSPGRCRTPPWNASSSCNTSPPTLQPPRRCARSPAPRWSTSRPTARSTGTTAASSRRRPPSPPEPVEEQSAVVRAFVDGVDRLRDWARAYDPAEVGPALQPQQCDALEQLLADLQAFADAARSTRHG